MPILRPRLAQEENPHIAQDVRRKEGGEVILVHLVAVFGFRLLRHETVRILLKAGLTDSIYK